MSYLLPSQLWNPYQVWATDYSQHRIHLNCYINGKGVKMMFDTGSDVTMVSPQVARYLGLTGLKPIDYLSVTGVGGSASRLPIVRTTLKIEQAAPFEAEIVLGDSNFNLLSRKELTRVFNINITATGVSLVPKPGVAGPAKRSTSAPVFAPQFEETPSIGIGGIPPVILVAGGLILFAMVLR